jgi:membrane protein implicated in regulation of membrane protease activity
MPKWWRIASTTVLYAAYLLWLVPFILYFQGAATLLGAIGWLVAVIVFQFVLANLVSLIEFLSTGSKIEQLRRADNDRTAQQGDPE